ncbi:polyamine aminopropyltransferase [Methylomagnum ishizawai]|uniref:polyamine aminopropyltransferase n=1 Tax=Methylomagnum ishizawai TaxID=1760988 RepID=UPI001C337147|nr:polyamine aminopropyltransferase [Methylomagnum ishizawai]BBL75006.1 polyamine aminopropyltransferase 1 [Methylomagnum ishizawai]
MKYALLVSVFLIASCGLVYELIAGAMASYLLGDSVTRFSTVIGTYLFAMGIGSWLSKHIGGNLILRFVQIELAVGLFGGMSAAVLFLLFAQAGAPFMAALYGLVLAVGVLVGLEIPLLMRILHEKVRFRELVSEVLTFDYLGALAVSLLFPLVLAPRLGMIRTALLFGLLNALVAAATLWLFRGRPGPWRWAAGQCAAVTVLLLAGLAGAGRLTAYAEAQFYSDDIVYAETTPYQRIVLTRWADDLRLFLNGNLQFSARDEYRYHEALVHPGLAALPWAKRVLVLGGGDGLAVREILKHPDVEAVTLVELDPAMTRLFSRHEWLRGLNGGALTDPRVRVVNADAMVWLDRTPELFDFIVADFPDPTSFGIGKLYTTAFYRLLDHHLARTGLLVVQSTSPYAARRSFWCVVNTLAAVGFHTWPYHAYVASFGEWGFILAGHGGFAPAERLPLGLRFLDAQSQRDLFRFPQDMGWMQTEVNRLDNQVLVGYHEADWNAVAR